MRYVPAFLTAVLIAGVATISRSASAAEPAPNATAAAATTAPATPASATIEEFPKPSLYPKSWELKFEHSSPKRVVVQAETSSVPKAYWYITYTVTNETDKEQLFLPHFDLVTKDGKIFRSDKNIPKKVFDTIKKNEGNQLMTNHALIGGELRLGIDEAKDGVAIWEEPDAEMGTFSVFIPGSATQNNGRGLVFPTKGTDLFVATADSVLQFDSATGDTTSNDYVDAVGRMQQIALRIGLADAA